MLSRRELGLFYGVLRITCSCYVIPYDFSYSNTNSEFNFQPTASVFKRRFALFHLGFCLFYAAFNTIRLTHMINTFLKPDSIQTVKFEELVLGFFFLIIRYFHLLLPLTLGNLIGQFSQLVNRQSVLNSRMG